MANMCNPLSMITGAICPHYKICKKNCILERERAITQDNFFNEMPNHQADLIGKSALIVGSGPSGLTAASVLVKRGCKVTVIEKNAILGGALWLIPDLRLNKKNIELIVDELRDSGVQFQTKRDFDFMELEVVTKQFDFIIIAIGTYTAKQLGIKGEEKATYAYGFLKSPLDKNIGYGKNAIIIGGGNVAMDCASYAIHQGYATTLCYRRKEEHLKANPSEFEIAKRAGTKFEFEMTPNEITNTGVYFTRNNNRSFLPCAKVVIAIGQFAQIPESVEKFKNVFIVGDANLGASSVLAAVTDAKKISYKIK